MAGAFVLLEVVIVLGLTALISSILLLGGAVTFTQATEGQHVYESVSKLRDARSAALSGISRDSVQVDGTEITFSLYAGTTSLSTIRMASSSRILRLIQILETGAIIPSSQLP